MDSFLSRQFHKQTNHDFAIGSSPLDSKNWPKEWKEIYYKEYPRFEKVRLLENNLILGDFKIALTNRCSQREFDPKKELTLEELSSLLFYSVGIKPSIDADPNAARRFYPSGGARYPLEVYLGIQRVKGVTPGIYHYNIKNHILEALTVDPKYLDSLKEGLYSPWAQEAAVFYIITAVWNRTFIKYGDLGYRLILFEAGHLTQNLSLLAASLDIGCCNLAGFHNIRLDELLDIINEDEDSLYMTVLGKSII
jgi:SagB-type dehydrogenase family enzyme